MHDVNPITTAEPLIRDPGTTQRCSDNLAGEEGQVSLGWIAGIS